MPDDSSLRRQAFHWLQFWSKLSLTTKGVLILLLPISCWLITISCWMASRNQETRASEWVIHTEQVLSESSGLLQSLVDAQTGVRGYHLTKDADFLKPYQDSLQDIQTRLSTLNQLLADNPQQIAQLNQLESLIQEKQRLLNQNINLIRRELVEEQDLTPDEANMLRDLTYQGRAQMNRVRQAIDTFQSEEQQLLGKRQKRLAATQQWADTMLILSGLLSIGGYSAAIYLFHLTDRQLQAQRQELRAANQALSLTNDDLTLKNKELDQFTYVASHDLKAPLRGIFQISDWLEEDLADQLPEESKTHLNLLKQRVLRMQNLIDGLLEYSRVGRSPSTVEPVDVQQLVEEIIDSLSPPEGFHIEIQSPLPTLNTDRLALYQVFSNLISNAIKHSHRDDGRVAIAVTYKNQIPEFSVQDNGPGIEADYHDKIFTIFQTLSSRDAKENTGIGLSIVKKMVELQGGRIWLTSQPGEGTTFFFQWPESREMKK